MKVILVNRYFFPDESATSRLFTSLGTALAKQGVAVHAVTSACFHDDPAKRLPALEKDGSLAIHRIWSTRYGRGKLFGRAADYATVHVSTFVCLLRLMRRGDVCVAGTDPPLLSVTAALACALTGGGLVNWVFDLFPEVAAGLGVIRKNSLAANVCLTLRNLSFRHARMNVVPMAGMSRKLEEIGIPQSRIAVVTSWSNGDEIRPIPAGDCDLRREWGLDGKFVLGYSGNLGRVHDFGTFLDVAVRLRDREDIAFLFLGGGHRRGWVESEAQKRGLRNILMKPLQPRERLAEALSVPDVHLVSLLPAMEPYVVPSKFYGIAAAGRPTLFVGDTNGEIARLVTQHSCGAAVPIGDADGLETWILELKRSAKIRETMGTNARVLFEQSFTEPQGIANWRRLLNAACSRALP